METKRWVYFTTETTIAAAVSPTSASITRGVATGGPSSATTTVPASAATATLPDHMLDVKRPRRRVWMSPPTASTTSRDDGERDEPQRQARARPTRAA